MDTEARLSSERIRRIYDRLGRRYDLMGALEARSKREALLMLGLAPGERVLELGFGPGAMLPALIRATGGAGPAEGGPPLVHGLDLSPVMVRVAGERLRAAGLSQAADLRAGNAGHLPYAAASFDAVYSTYMVDLLTTDDIGAVLREAHRVLRPGGRIVVVTLHPSTQPVGRLFTRAYTWLYVRRPTWLAGCRPVTIGPLLSAAGFTPRARRAWYFGVVVAVLAEQPA